MSASHFRAAESGQLSFFGSIVGVEDEIKLPFAPGVDTREQLEWERELIGLYVSDHPLAPYDDYLKRKITHFSGQLKEATSRSTVTVAGLVTKFRNHQTKTGKAMGFITLEDIQGSIELVVFPKVWEMYHALVQMDAVLIAEGKVDAEGGDPKVLVDRLIEARLDEGEGESNSGYNDGYTIGEDDIQDYVPNPREQRKVAEPPAPAIRQAEVTRRSQD